MENVRQEIESLKTVNRRIVATLVRLEGKVDDMAERMATKDDLAQLRSEMNQRSDDLVARFEDLRFRYSVHADTLFTHDKRLKKLEARR